jgi:hypothetical protein
MRLSGRGTASRFVVVLALIAIGFVPTDGEGRNVNWSGYSWWVRTSQGNPQGPGPNIFSDSTQNVSVDAEGNLHLKIIQGANGKWTAAEVDLNQSLGYGTYEWEVSSRYDQYATNVVGGLFTYLDPGSVANQTGGSVGNGVADTPHEIDIEFTKAWGNANLYFTTHDPDVQPPSKNYYQPLNGDFTTHRFTWKPDSITWESFHGHVAGNPNPPNPIIEQRPGPNQGKPARHVYTGPVVPEDLNEVTIMNLWLFGENVSNTGPSNGQPHEMIVKSFTYTPLPPAPIPGDFDENGEVDASDFQDWRENFGSTTELAADGNGDGVVNAADYTVWRDNLQSVASSLSESSSLPQSIPEPNSLLTLLWIVVYICSRR